MRYIISILFIVFVTNISLFAQQEIFDIDCSKIVKSKLKELKKDFLALHELYNRKDGLKRVNEQLEYIRENHFEDSQKPSIEKFYLSSATQNNGIVLSSPAYFLIDLNFLKIKDIELIEVINCRLCQSQNLNYFFTPKIKITYENTDKKRRFATNLRFEFVVYEDNKKNLKIKIRKILFFNSRNATKCKTPKTPPPNEPDSLPHTPKPSYPDLQPKVDSLIVEINKKKAEIKILNDTIYIRNVQIVYLKQDTLIKADTIRQNREDLAKAKYVIDSLKRDLDTLVKVRNCLVAFQESSAIKRNEARIALDTATNKYAKLHRNAYTEVKKRKILKEIWDTYIKFGESELSIDCGPLKFKYKQNYKTPKENLITAQILARNEGSIIDSLDGNLRQKMNRANKILLAELGKAIEFGDYDIGKACQQIIERIPDLITPELKPGQSAQVIQNIAKIDTLYKKGKYAQVIGIYSKYHRYFTLSEIRDQIPKEINSANYCVGAILMWNLGDIDYYRAFYIDDEPMNIAEDDRLNKGKKLLKKVADNISFPRYRKKAAIALAKEFN